ncbi:MAG TPA: hypothetical protein VHW01_25135 [Polyangiaceae bacterium]|nr:hypothetical protein [Polyangiaceae bacterium]
MIGCFAFALLASRVGAAQPSVVRVSVLASDGRTWLDPVRDHLAISREMPTRFDPAQPAPLEPEGFRLVFSGLGATPSSLRISTRRSSGALLDALADPVLVVWPCPPGASVGSCWATLPLRLTPDRLDRDYPAARERSLEAELGGDLYVEAAGRALGDWRVSAPHSPLFSGVERLSLKLRVRVLRLSAGGAPAVGTDTASAIAIARAEVQAASKLWAQCGIDLIGPAGPDVQVVDPPPIELIAVGCEAGLPASGGQLSLRVQGRRLRIASRPGESPVVVAERLARAIRGLGLTAQIGLNQRTSAGASGAVDVLVRGSQGNPISISADADASVPLSTDATLGVCLGEVDLGNGLSHFVESDAAAGTLEERALVKAFDDGDPTTIEVFIVPSFDQSGRIGESFIDDDGAGIQNTVIIDRAALRAGPRSYALAHELGHILLDMPGHPDDYGVDQSSSLMDSDASDASVFGPRRLSLAECERAMRESGPKARVPLLSPSPVAKKPSPKPATSVR